MFMLQNMKFSSIFLLSLFIYLFLVTIDINTISFGSLIKKAKVKLLTVYFIYFFTFTVLITRFCKETKTMCNGPS